MAIVPYIYWNNRGDFKKAPRYCATGVKYGAQWLVDSKGVATKRHQSKDYFYLLGKEKAHYPVPATKQEINTP